MSHIQQPDPHRKPQSANHRQSRISFFAQLGGWLVVFIFLSGSLQPSAPLSIARVDSHSFLVRTMARRQAEAPHPSYYWGLIGSNPRTLARQQRVGLNVIVFSLSWRNYAPSEGSVDSEYVALKAVELSAIRAAGFEVILSLGFHDTPSWLHERYPNSHYRNQYGELYEPEFAGDIDLGDANLVFNPTLRTVAAAYISSALKTFGPHVQAVRLGGGRYGELTYPPADYRGETNSYWAFDANAQTQSPVPGWKPGDPTRNGEAERFLAWYLDALVDYQTWQIQTVRRDYPGPIMMLYPSWGIRPGQMEAALEDGLQGQTPAERNGELQRGFDFARQIAALDDPLIIITTTWLDADASADDREDPRYWSPVKYLSVLAAQHRYRYTLYGENTGQGDRATLALSARQMQRYGLIGMAWYRETEMASGAYATLEDYAGIIQAFQK